MTSVVHRCLDREIHHPRIYQTANVMSRRKKSLPNGRGPKSERDGDDTCHISDPIGEIKGN